MSRRGRTEKREMLPDPKYNNYTLAKFMNKIMICGKKGAGERIFYDALDIIEKGMKKDPVDVFEQAMKNATPSIQVKPRRVAGATYQVPVEVKGERGTVLAMRWIVAAAKARKERSMAEKLAAELSEGAQGQGAG